MTRDEVHQHVATCKNCGHAMWLIHNVQTRKPKHWFCEPCYRWEGVRGRALNIDQYSWEAYHASDPELVHIKHGEQMQPALADINRG